MTLEREVALERQVLKAVVEDMNVHLELRFRHAPGAIAVGAHDDGHAGQFPSQQRRLVADFARLGSAAVFGRDGHGLRSGTPPVAARQNARLPPAREQPLREKLHQRSLPRTTHA